ncbi:hypothetical protein DFH27DRAFT_590017 [Peziza echinospora]|nr:hypothetical protein DFH27DRAFT_590017 [Peziza echinospora]
MAGPPKPPPPQWVIDVSGSALPAASSRPTGNKPLDPPGYGGNSSGGGNKKTTPQKPPPTSAETDALLLKKAWELALSPSKALPMSLIMMYMSGNSLQIFSIMMVWMAFANPVKAIFSVNGAFARFENERTKGSGGVLWCKVVFILCQFLALAAGVWKVNGMGLLPNRRSDWLAWETSRFPREDAGVGIGTAW